MAGPRAAIFGRDFARALGGLARPYWESPDSRPGKLLLALAVALELGTVFGAFFIAGAQRRIFDALGDRDTGAFLSSIGLFLLPRAAIVSIAHRPAVVRFHARRWVLSQRAGAAAVLEAA